MSVQTVVTDNLAFGVVGEIQNSTPSVVYPFIADSASGNVVGYAFTQTEEGKAVVGGTGIFVGILCNPKAYVNFNGDLSANNEIKQGTLGEFLTKGAILLDLNGTASIADGIFFVNATGALGAGTAAAGQTQITGAKVINYEVGANGLALVQIW